MSVRTYVPTILRLLKTVCKFIARYQDQLNSHLTAPQQAFLGQVVVACNAFIAAVGVLPIGD